MPIYFQVPLDDVERVEVLLGPQGTLYGSGSEAGTIRFIPKRPNFNDFSADVTANTSYSQYAGAPNGSVHAAVNFPIADRLALRIVAGDDYSAGFVDAVDRAALQPDGTPVPSVPGDPTSGFVLGPIQHNTNWSNQWFTRASLRWQPLDAVDLQADYIHQSTKMADDQYASAWPGGPWDSSFRVWPNATVETRPGCTHCTTTLAAEPFSDSLDVVDVVATADFGLATVTSGTSFYEDKIETTFDQTGEYCGLPSPPTPNGSLFIPYYPYNNYPRLIGLVHQPSENRAITQELRLVSSPTKYIDYVAGAYFQVLNQSNVFQQTEHGILAYNKYIDTLGLGYKPVQGYLGDTNYQDARQTRFLDRAIFGEVTYHFTSELQVTAGVRLFDQEFQNNTTINAALCGAPCASDQADPSGLATSRNSSRFRSGVPKLNASYDFNSNLKVYATFSEGFRRGGVSGLPVGGPYASLPVYQTFSPERLNNYELGIKGSLLDRRFSFSADAYLDDIKRFQFDGINLSGIIGAYNGKTARSKGFELQTSMQWSSALQTSLGFAYTDAYVTEAFDIIDLVPYTLVAPPVQTASIFGGPVPKRTQLPGVSKTVVIASIDYSIPWGSPDWTWKAHLDGNYRSSQLTTLSPSSIFNWTIPSKFLLNARLALGEEKKTSYYVFARNLTNNPDYTGSENDQLFSNLYQLRNIGRPRTIGVGIDYHFGGH